MNQQPMNIQMIGADDGWMQKPIGLPDCPPGLEYLMQLDQILVKQKVEIAEILLGCEMANKYKIKNSLGQQFYYAREETETCMRICCGNHRGFTLSITDNLQQEVMVVRREFKCCAGCCWCAGGDCCAYEVIIEAPRGNIIGYARQEKSCWKAIVSVRNRNHEIIGRVLAPCCPVQCCCNDLHLPVMAIDNSTQIGKITKQWRGCLKESFTDADSFSISFPVDMDVKAKAAFLGALFLVDFMLFETSNNNH